MLDTHLLTHPATVPGGGGDGGGEKSIGQELLEMFKYSWTVFWNLALFLYFANVLHK
jgi:hypothetical protein